MAKRSTNPARVKKPDEAASLLRQLAEMMLADHFFDPDNEQAYKRLLSQKRPDVTGEILLDEETLEVGGLDCTLRIEALRSWTQFRVVIIHPAFTASVEGAWSFEKEALGNVKVTRTGKADKVEATIEALIQAIDGDGLDDEEFADFLQGLDDDGSVPLIGDNPAEPPAATAMDRNRLKAVIKRVCRRPEAGLNLEDRGWLEQTPQLLPAIIDGLIDAVRSKVRNAMVVETYQMLLSLELEFVRYRQDRGWDWATAMLEEYQRRLIELGMDDTVSRADWFGMCAALTEARVPVSDAMQTALAEAGFKPDELAQPPDEMMRMLRQFMDQLAGMVDSAFEVIDALHSSAALLPAALRSFLATELALSPHEVLRDAVPLLLLDEDSAVRMAAAGALEQIAHPSTLSPDALRRSIILRNWLPMTDRPRLDVAIRKARLAGVEIGAWPEPARDLEFHASMIDGSGAQSILGVSRSGKHGVFAGLLIRHGTGVVDGWADHDLARSKISKLLREAQMAAPSVRVDKAFVDMTVQHAVSTSVGQNGVPPTTLLEMAELFGGTEWRDRRLDAMAEADRMFVALEAANQTPEGVEAAYRRGIEWMAKDEVFGTWFEDGPQVHKALAPLPRTDQVGMTAVVMQEILPAKRAQWTERFLMLALWCEAATDTRLRHRVPDLVPVVHALAKQTPINAIPAMRMIAAQTVRAALLGGW